MSRSLSGDLTSCWKIENGIEASQGVYSRRGAKEGARGEHENIVMTPLDVLGIFIGSNTIQKAYCKWMEVYT